MNRKLLSITAVFLTIIAFSTSTTALGEAGAGMSTNETGDIDIIYGDASAEWQDTNGNTFSPSGRSNNPGGYGDIDGDGKPEFATKKGVNDADDIGYFDADGTFTDLGVDGTEPTAVMDYDNDGDQDIAYIDGGTTGNPIDIVDDSGNNQQIVGSIDYIGGAGDVDGDGNIELFYQDSAFNTDIEYTDHQTSGAEGTITPPISGSYTRAVGAVADFDNDGTMEVAYSNNGKTGYTDINGNGGQFVSYEAENMGGAADWDEDGLYELSYWDSSRNELNLVDKNGQTQTLSGGARNVGGITDIDGDNVDQTPPQISYNPDTPADGTTQTQKDWIFVNITATDNEQLSTVEEYFDGSTSSFNTNNGDYYWTNHTSLSNGDYSFNATATDAESNTNSTSTRTVTIDNDVTAPNINTGDVIDNNDGDDAVKDGESVTIQANVTDARSSLSQVNGTVFGNTYTLTDGDNDDVFDTTTTVPVGTSDGQKDLQVQATDDDNNYASNTFTNVITVDNTDPSISSITLTDNDDGDSVVSSGQSFTVSADITSTSNIVTAEATVFGNTYTLTDGNDDDTYDTTQSVPSVSDGSYSAEIYAEDDVGNNKTKTGGSITADSTAPTINNPTITDDTDGDGSLTVGEDAKITADVTDSHLETLEADFLGNTVSMSNTGGDTYSGTYTLQSGDGTGTDSATITASDTADNSNSDTTGTITYDGDVPVISNFDLAQVDTKKYNLSFDSDEELEKINVSFDGDYYTRQDFTESGSFTYEKQFVRDAGQYTAELLEAEDGAGNTASVGQTDTVYPPVITVEPETPANDSTVFEQFTVNFTASDQDGNINETYFTLNGDRVNGSDTTITDQQTNNIDVKMYAVNDYGTTATETRSFKLQNELIGIEAFSDSEIYAADKHGIFRTDVNETIEWSTNVSDVTSIAERDGNIYVASSTGLGTTYLVDKQTGTLTEENSLGEVAAADIYFWGFRKSSGTLSWSYIDRSDGSNKLGQYSVSPIEDFNVFDAAVNDDGDATIALSEARAIRLNPDGTADFDKSRETNETAATNGYSIFSDLGTVEATVDVYLEGGGLYASYDFPNSPDQDIRDLEGKAGSVFAVTDGRNNTARLDIGSSNLTEEWTRNVTDNTPVTVEVDKLDGYAGDEKGYIYSFNAFNVSEFNTTIANFGILSQNITTSQEVPVEVNVDENYPVTSVEVNGQKLTETQTDGEYTGTFTAPTSKGNYTATARAYTSEGLADSATEEYEVIEYESEKAPLIDFDLSVIVPILAGLLLVLALFYARRRYNRWKKGGRYYR